jgi:hypothetical protein
MTEVELRQRLSGNRAMALAASCALGVLLSYLHDVAQHSMFVLGEWAFYRYLADPGSWVPEAVFNFTFQAFSFIVPSVLVLLMLGRLLHLESMLFPSVAYATNLVYHLWWVPIALLLRIGPDAENVLPVLPAYILGTALAYFSVAYLVLRRNAR